MKIFRTETYKNWYNALRDIRAQERIKMRLKRLLQGNVGDVVSVGEGVFEMRIHYGQGYRIYYKNTGKEIVLLLCGGNKSTQTEDIINAKQLANSLPKQGK